MMRRSEVLSLAGAAIVSSVLPARAQQSPAIRLGIVAVEEGAALYYAQERGFFRQAGVNVELTKFPNGAAVAQGVIAGALDFGVTNSGSLALGHERGLPIALVACVALFTQASPLCHFVVGERSGIRSAQDLSGRTVATSGLKDMLHISTLAWIDSKGGDSKSVNFVEIPFPQMAAAVLARRVDGATIVEPFYTRSRDELEQIGLNYVAVNDGRPFQTLGLVANTRWLSENGATAVKISEVVHAAARWANRNHDEAAKLLADFTQTDPSVVRAYPRVVFAERNSPEYVQPVIDMMARYGALRRRFAAADVFAAGLA